MIVFLRVWTRHWRAPIIESAHLFYCQWMRFGLLQRLGLCQWYVLIPIGFNFIIAERVKLVFNQFYKNPVISLVILYRMVQTTIPLCYTSLAFLWALSFYWLYIEGIVHTMISLRCTSLAYSNDEVLRITIYYECFPVREIDDWLFYSVLGY